METDITTDPTPDDAAIDLLARLERTMKATHDTSPSYCRWTDTARAALNVIADWQAEMVGRNETGTGGNQA